MGVDEEPDGDGDEPPDGELPVGLGLGLVLGVPNRLKPAGQ